MLASTGPEKAFDGCIVELAMLDAAEVGGVADAVADVDGGRLNVTLPQ